MRRASNTLDFKSPRLSARLVFVRPQRILASQSTPFLLERRSARALGESLNGSVFTLDLAPGEYEFCLAQPAMNLSGWRYHWGEFDFSRILRTPLTRVEVAAGTTSLFEVHVVQGLLEIVPARRGSERARRLEKRLPELQVLEPISEAAELQAEAQDLAPWLENCVDSSPSERWRLGVDEGR
jgi:hypothetical protein